MSAKYNYMFGFNFALNRRSEMLCECKSTAQKIGKNGVTENS